MLQRYDYEWTDHRAYIFDRRTNGMGSHPGTSVAKMDVNRAIAVCTDVDQAQRIVDLLNASDEKRKEPK